MSITSVIPSFSAPPAPPAAPATSVAAPSVDPRETYVQCGGTIGAGIGAFIGRTTIAPTIGLTAGAAIGSAFGPLGVTAGGVVGVAAGLYFEFKGKFQGIFPIGRLVGGLVGGAVGMALGKTAQLLHVPAPTQRMADEMKGFTLGSLPGKLLNPTYTSHPVMTPADTKHFQGLLQTGDVIVSNNDVYMDFEIPERILGVGGDWTHSVTYAGNGRVIEALGARGVIERDLGELVESNHHLMILRPRYKSPAEAQAVVDEARRHIGNRYDGRFSLKTDERMYCIEHTYKSVSRGAPHIQMKPHSLLGLKFVSPETFTKSPDMDLVYSTGSSFRYNYLSKFD